MLKCFGEVISATMLATVIARFFLYFSEPKEVHQIRFVSAVGDTMKIRETWFVFCCVTVVFPFFLLAGIFPVVIIAFFVESFAAHPYAVIYNFEV